MSEPRKLQKAWPRAVCSMCGWIYINKQWRHGKVSGQVGCGVRTCTGKLWIIPNKAIGWAVEKLDRDMRANHAKLQIIGERISN